MDNLDGAMVEAIMDEIKAELVKASTKFLPIRSFMELYGILDEEMEETKIELRKNDLAGSRKELIQVAAMAIRGLHDVIYKAKNPKLLESKD